MTTVLNISITSGDVMTTLSNGRYGFPYSRFRPLWRPSRHPLRSVAR